MFLIPFFQTHVALTYLGDSPGSGFFFELAGNLITPTLRHPVPFFSAVPSQRSFCRPLSKSRPSPRMVIRRFFYVSYCFLMWPLSCFGDVTCFFSIRESCTHMASLVLRRGLDAPCNPSLSSFTCLQFRSFWPPSHWTKNVSCEDTMPPSPQHCTETKTVQ